MDRRATALMLTAGLLLTACSSASEAKNQPVNNDTQQVSPTPLAPSPTTIRQVTDTEAMDSLPMDSDLEILGFKIDPKNSATLDTYSYPVDGYPTRTVKPSDCEPIVALMWYGAPQGEQAGLTASQGTPLVDAGTVVAAVTPTASESYADEITNELQKLLGRCTKVRVVDNTGYVLNREEMKDRFLFTIQSTQAASSEVAWLATQTADIFSSDAPQSRFRVKYTWDAVYQVSNVGPNLILTSVSRTNAPSKSSDQSRSDQLHSWLVQRVADQITP